MAAIDQLAGNQVDYVLIGFHDAFNISSLAFSKASRHQCCISFHRMGITGFVLQRERNNAGRGPRPLSSGDDAGDSDESAITQFDQLALAFSALK